METVCGVNLIILFALITSSLVDGLPSPTPRDNTRINDKTNSQLASIADLHSSNYDIQQNSLEFNPRHTYQTKNESPTPLTNNYSFNERNGNNKKIAAKQKEVPEDKKTVGKWTVNTPPKIRQKRAWDTDSVRVWGKRGNWDGEAIRIWGKRSRWDPESIRVWGKRSDFDSKSTNGMNLLPRYETEKRAWDTDSIRMWGKRNKKSWNEDNLWGNSDKRAWDSDNIRVWGKRNDEFYPYYFSKGIEKKPQTKWDTDSVRVWGKRSPNANKVYGMRDDSLDLVDPVASLKHDLTASQSILPLQKSDVNGWLDEFSPKLDIIPANEYLS